ncbi:MAG: tRNA (guanosine(46)-N7)-methyltransferase TrmB [Eubacteriales bacterium]|nr:tRNA (guanosine(46)-N7)-methyltransferase TrmB [Eubacteriales bacterium]
MRMRKRKNAAARLEDCGHLWIREPQSLRGRWREVFGNENPIHLEIGCGKGAFVAEMARRNPDINFIAIEKFLDILVLAAEKGKENALSNVRYIVGDATFLTEIFASGEVQRIYLNFSDPWPKTKHAKRRLTHKNFLDLYRRIMDEDAWIHLKTDNKRLFEFSLNSFCDNDFRLKNITLDLHNSKFEGNVMTEYEKRFSESGQPIYRLEASCRAK